ncbi:hypothetical protein DUI87_21496 [Hirundo rustica rustica]|uniref:Myelin-associated neurite-outgrowth inhibitor n=1 Tax=Hirundo rustica rustica TaxID=333673 RepID=A0A3M0JMN0_HIRRU|nr:hypothetical protein DUI87_21496 [Hirundo rustica rustica]
MAAQHRPGGNLECFVTPEYKLSDSTYWFLILHKWLFYICHVLVTEIMNPVYSPGSSGVPYANAKGIGYPAGFPMGYAAAAPAYSPNMYPGANPTFQTGYTPGTPYKVSCSPTSGAVPPYSSSPNPYQTAVYPVRSAYPQQNPYAQQGTYYTQPLYAAPPHVIHHTTVVQPNGMPATMYPAPIPPPRGNGVTMGMVAGTTMAMSAGLKKIGTAVQNDTGNFEDEYFVDNSFPDSSSPSSSYHAHVSGSRNTNL